MHCTVAAGLPDIVLAVCVFPLGVGVGRCWAWSFPHFPLAHTAMPDPPGATTDGKDGKMLGSSSTQLPDRAQRSSDACAAGQDSGAWLGGAGARRVRPWSCRGPFVRCAGHGPDSPHTRPSPRPPRRALPQVEYYGTPTPLRQVATINAPEAALLVVQPYEPSTISVIEKAIVQSDLGLTPTNNGRLIRIRVPPLTTVRCLGGRGLLHACRGRRGCSHARAKVGSPRGLGRALVPRQDSRGLLHAPHARQERRKQLAKTVGKLAEEARVAIRWAWGVWCSGMVQVGVWTLPGRLDLSQLERRARGCHAFVAAFGWGHAWAGAPKHTLGRPAILTAVVGPKR